MPRLEATLNLTHRPEQDRGIKERCAGRRGNGRAPHSFPPAQSWEQSTPLDKKQLTAGAVSAGTCWLRQGIGGGWEREGCKQGVEAEEGQGVWRQDQDMGKEQ